MTAPKWIENEVKPVAVGDVLKYLTQALELKPLGVIDIGGDRLTFRDMMQVYAEVRGLKRTIITVPVLALKLAALWVGLVTPISNSLAVPLMEGTIHPVVGNTEKAKQLFPDIKPNPYPESVETAISHVLEGKTATRLSGTLGGESSYSISEQQGLIRERRSIYVDSPSEAVFNVLPVWAETRDGWSGNGHGV